MPLPTPSVLEKSPREILVIKPSSLGDVVHTLPSVALLRRAFPEARIHWLINTEWAPLLAGNPHIDEAIEFPRRDFRGMRGALRIAPWARQLRDRIAADWIIDYQGLLRSALLAKLCRADDTRVFGLSNAREGSRLFYDEIAEAAWTDHAVLRNLKLTRLFTGGGEPEAPLSWPLPGGDKPAGFEPEDRFIVLHPFSRGSGKSLDASQVAEFCRSLTGYKIVIAGHSDVALPEMEGVINLLNQTTLLQLIWLLRYAQYVVSVDSGPMHIAAAFTSRLVSIHTWSDPLSVGPYQPDAWVWKDGVLSQVKDLASPERHLPAPAIADVATHVARQIGA